VLAAVIFNALIIVALVPLALRGVKYKPQSAAEMLRRNLWIYGVGGFIAPFPCIWFIDRVLGLLRLRKEENMWQQLGTGFKMMLVLTVLTGLLYPGVVTGLCQVFFPARANGSLVVANGHAIGSELIGRTSSGPSTSSLGPPRPATTGTIHGFRRL